jgi:hypothetical protein
MSGDVGLSLSILMWGFPSPNGWMVYRKSYEKSYENGGL